MQIPKTAPRMPTAAIAATMPPTIAPVCVPEAPLLPDEPLLPVLLLLPLLLRL